MQSFQFDMLDSGQCVYSISVIYIPYVTYVCRFRLCIAEQRFPVVLWVGKPRGGEEGRGRGSSEKSSNVKASLDRRLLWLHCTTLLSMSWRRIGLGAKKSNSPFPDVFPPHFLTILTIVFKDPSLFLCTTESRKRSSLGCYLVRFPDLGNLTQRCFLEEGPL